MSPIHKRRLSILLFILLPIRIRTFLVTYEISYFKVLKKYLCL